ncbi:bifunctional diaminohydroxyphosphoribosylaminopyrimidine deaminase/5-amino-6-(5-phosphoribosylamino)uracil reductase RibD [Catalinimonas niigatensis]|uniref:bifunctional diaminohydroxyphosphoribosylaminopyrimidine deaminase/5-amino-6-(5-phosphoribosylamino)uracil reductase RibD n=1 Tax=Catalinimonas niigatensis TaxID=1397264 RepID=UPI0026661EC3|nr:bifunctional diaminohydroxyphosphoribosylaminopyrimidine deaminase/5-amino-6-(5-phosphoribosylamino)uracil reductase RibD [Catalinimonas niigatensis]WPP50553.1 bifunctional diaminohydroxyphosphoribosylaminopyrimidine deaminase/5-amino-6-(5-phosphoribosylamino)uracil reductase RibD [Catalinimonas niigatensis]
MREEEKYMQQVFDLARKGEGRVSPNPLVGCIIVRDGDIIGQGWHNEFGKAHAERNAVDNVTDKNLLIGSTVYVNLEPCSHFGKTSPCSDLLVFHKVSKVVISNVDPNPLVNGRGIQRLRKAGIEVITGILSDEGEKLNATFFCRMKQKTHIETVD